MRVSLFLFIFLWFTPLILPAQDEDKDILWFNAVNEKQGLSPGGFNFFVYRDSEGLVWINSVFGLNRFDGQQIKEYHWDPLDSTSISGENIQSSFYEDSDKNLWFCTYRSVQCYDRKSDHFRTFQIRDSLDQPIKENYKVFYLERDSFLWFRVRENVYRMDIRNPDNYQQIFKTEYYNFYVSADQHGAVRYIISGDNKTPGFEFRTIIDGQVKSTSNHFYEDAQINNAFFENINTIWLASSIGLLKWDGITHDFKMAHNKKNPYGIIPWGKEHLILSFNDKELVKFNKHSQQTTPYLLNAITDPTAVFDSAIRNLYLDHENILWMTTHPDGLVYASLNKQKLKAIPSIDIPGLSGAIEFKNFIEYNDHIWCSFREGILVYNKNAELINHIESTEITADTSTINYTLKDQSGLVWVATNDGLSIYDPAKAAFQNIPKSKGIEFLYLYQLKNGRILGTTQYKGVFEIIPDFENTRIKNLIRSQGYTSIFEDQLGQIYICKEEAGIKVLGIESDTLLIRNNLPIPGSVHFFHEAEDEKTLWLGTSFGLFSINKHQPDEILQNFSIRNKLPDNNIYSIIPKGEYELFLSTGKGLVAFNTANHSVRTYTLEEGMLSRLFKPFAALKLSTGDIWMGGSNGITIIPEQLSAQSSNQAKIILSEIKINDEPDPKLSCEISQSTNINQIQKLQLPYSKNTLSLGFKLADYTAPGSIQLKYKLEGEDNHWITLKKGHSGFTRYPNLSHGTYHFLMQGANSDGSWSKQKVLEIDILPPIWKTWWFRTLAILTIFAIVFLIFQYRVNQIKKTSELKTRIAENKMAALVGQMNPHFIFNSLQSINSYILKNDKRKASEYLGRFSKLMRMILENSRQSNHSLEEEIKLLRLYLRVEAQRFKNPFQYEVIIDEEIDPYETYIPAMMLQPFVENAIWHGVSNKEDSGNITIDISNKDNLLKCVIEDDGVGRAKAIEIAAQKGKSHQSRALEIITERLNLLFPNQQHLCSIEYIDLFDKCQSPCGTRVEIYLPMID